MTLNAEASKVQTTIIECVDSALETFGESVKKAIYFHLEKQFQLRKSDIPERPEDFFKALTSIFGKGAKSIEALIVQKMQQKYKVKLSSKTFQEAVLAIKAKSIKPAARPAQK